MITVDTNVLAYLLLAGEHSAAARARWQQDPEWHAPQLWHSELLNVVSMAMRAGRLTPALAEQSLEQAETLMRGRSHLSDARAVLQLAEHSKCSAYDLEFVALALRLGVPLVTMDRQILREFPELAVALAGSGEKRRQ